MTIVLDKADCNGQRNVPVSLVLYAVVDMTQQTEGMQMQDKGGLMGSFSPHSPMGTNGGYVAPPLTTGQEAQQDMSTGLKNEAPGAVKAGQVVGLEKVSMSVGTGVEGGSVLESSRKSFTVHAKAELVMIPRPVAKLAGVEKASLEKHEVAGGMPVVPPKPPAPPVDVTEICAVDCSGAVDSTEADASAAATKAEAHVGLRRLGYLPQGHEEMTDFDDATTLNYLSPDQILVTFDPHHLRHRQGEAWDAGIRTTVRAVLINSHTNKVLRVEEWDVDGVGAYLWKLGQGRVMVAMGGALKEIGADLKTVSVYPVSGVVQWVVASPDGGHIVIGMLHERHSEEVHKRIAAISGEAPEEDLEVRLLDPERKSLVTVTGSSANREPVLSDSGEVSVRVVNWHRWEIVERRWDNSVKKLVTVNSDFAPIVSAPFGGALLVVGGSPGSSQRWYRVVRMDGRTLLKGTPSSQEIEMRGVSGGETVFALRAVETTVSTLTGGLVKQDQLKEERVSVYRKSDGKRVFDADVSNFPESKENFAISPNGAQVAVATQSAVAFYSVGQATP